MRPLVEKEGKLLIGVTFEEYLDIDEHLSVKLKGIRYNKDLILINADYWLASELADASCSNSKLEYPGTISFNMRSICNHRAVYLSKLGDYEITPDGDKIKITLTF